MKTGTRIKKTLVTLLSVAFLTMIPVLGAQAVFISPMLIVIKDRQVATKITVNNRGDTPRLIKLSWERRAMTEDGTMVKLEEGETLPGYRPADPYLRFSPRQFVLQPRRYQKIRMIAMRPGDMEPGEYRSHILLEERPVEENPDNTVAAIEEEVKNGEMPDEENEKGKRVDPSSTQNFGGELVVQVNKSTPVFLLHGETDVDLTLTKAGFVRKNDKDFLRAAVQNASTRSIYARLMLDCKTAGGELKSMAVGMFRLYPEAKNVENDFYLRELDLSACQSLDLRAIGYKDFEYDDKILSSIEVTR